MKITTDALASIKGRGSEPDLRDTEIVIPNMAVIAVPARSPLRVLDAAPTDTNGVEFSYLIQFDLLTAVVTPLTSYNLGYLAPGLWSLTCQYNELLDFGLTPAQGSPVGIRLVQPPAVLAQSIYVTGPGANWTIPPITITLQLQSVTQVVYVARAVAAAQSARCAGFLMANRHF